MECIIWGLVYFLGDGTASIASGTAKELVLPNPSGTIKMIGLVNSSSYYVLYTDGNLYAMGANGSGQLGTWNTTSTTVWVQPRYTSATGPVMNNIKWISGNESDPYTDLKSVNVINTSKN